MRATISLFFIALLSVPLSGCGQRGPLFMPPTCSPVLDDGTVNELTDEEGNILPPCPPAEPDSDEELFLQDEELVNDEI